MRQFVHHIFFSQNVALNFAAFFAMYIFPQINARKFAKTFAENLAIAKIPQEFVIFFAAHINP